MICHLLKVQNTCQDRLTLPAYWLLRMDFIVLTGWEQLMIARS